MAGGQLADGERPKCVSDILLWGEEATEWCMLNFKKTISASEKKRYREVFDKLHGIFTEANNKYLKSFLGVKEDAEMHLKDY